MAAPSVSSLSIFSRKAPPGSSGRGSRLCQSWCTLQEMRRRGEREREREEGRGEDCGRERGRWEDRVELHPIEGLSVAGYPQLWSLENQKTDLVVLVKMNSVDSKKDLVLC